MRKIKAVEFEVKVVFKGEVYLKVADVCKVFGYKTQKAFIADYSDKVIKIKGCGNCMKQSDYNQMLDEDEEASERQEIKEVTKVCDARIEYNGSKKILGLKKMFGLQRLAMLKNMSVDEYIEKVELPKNRQDAVSDTLKAKNDYDKYNEKIAKIKAKFSGLEQYGLELRFVTKESENTIDFRGYIVGNGIIREVTYSDEYDYCEYDKLYINEVGDIILPVYNFDADIRSEVNLSKTKIDRNFREFGMIENLLYIAQEEIGYVSMSDDDYIFSYDDDVFSLYVETDFIATMMKPEDSRYTYYDGVAEIEVDEIVCM